MQGHVIVCGLQGVGLRAVEQFSLSGTPVVVIDDDADPRRWRTLHDWGVPHVRRHAHHGRIRRHIPHHHRPRTHPRILPNRDVAQNLCAAADEHPIQQRRMPLALLVPRAAQRHTLVERHIVAHNRGLANHHPRAVVDKHTPPNLRSRMNLNPRAEPRHLRKNPRRQFPLRAPQSRGDPVHPHRVQPGIAKHHHRPRAGRRIACHHRIDIFANVCE